MSIYVNRFGIQINDVTRIIFQEERPGMPMSNDGGESTDLQGGTVADIVMSHVNARALRDLLVQYVKDDPAAA